jgi:predicted anti-sigma-YlaC factor YlaD
MTCDEIRETIHEAADDGRASAMPEPVRAHLATCAACREFANDLEALSLALRTLPLVPLPKDALDTVWQKTVRGPRGASTPAAGFWRLAAAAVLVTAFSTATLYFVFTPVRSPEPSSVEVARATAQAEMVFGYTARALAATRSAAADRVLASKVAPAVRGRARSQSARSKP